MKEKKVVTIQDISCFGKCSLTVALPIISSLGISCSVIPTAVLSTHTGGFNGYTFRDLTDDIPEISDHWKREGLEFDGICTGYLGSVRQVGIISDFIDNFGGNALVFVDPAMADRGVLYAGFTEEFIVHMRQLCAKADIIVPNITEASLLLGTEYIEKGYDEDYIKLMLKGLTDLGADTAVITGVSFDGMSQGVISYNSGSGEYCSYFSESIPVQCHGTGDIFSSSFFGGLILGFDMKRAMKIAVDFTVKSIKETVGDKNHWYGVKFEKSIPSLIRSAGIKPF